MASKNPPRFFCDPALRSTVEQAFDAAWTVLQARDPLRDFEQDYLGFQRHRVATIERASMGLSDNAFGSKANPAVSGWRFFLIENADA
jgi:hypothetical protein